MKFSSIETLARYFDTIDVSSDTALKTVVDEIKTEYNKSMAEKQAQRAMYEQAHTVVMRVLNDTPQTCAEIFNACAPALPAGFNRSNLSYAFREYWSNEVTVIKDKVNMYTKKVSA